MKYRAAGLFPILKDALPRKRCEYAFFMTVSPAFS